jgi:hypothetical protein
MVVIGSRPVRTLRTQSRSETQSGFAALSLFGYEPVAETMPAGTNLAISSNMIPSDSAVRTLRYLPKGKKIVVEGVITSERRLEEASKFVRQNSLRYRRNAASVHGRRQYPDRGRAMGQAEARGRLAKEVWRR